MESRPRGVLLIVFDGWGVGDRGPGDATALAATPVLDGLFADYPHTELAASGRAVGLPEGQMGNSEVGHTNLGAGRVVRQDLVRVDDAIANGSLAEVPALVAACDRAVERGGALHLFGLTSPGGVHSRFDHAVALARVAADRGVERILLHAFLDGRDVLPRSAADFLTDTVLGALADVPGARLASVSGRYFAMDRDQRWDRTERVLDALLRGDAEMVESDEAAVARVRDGYAADVTDEFVAPFLVGAGGTGGAGPVDPARDAGICFNFRPDRARQLTAKLTAAGLWLATMTRYSADFDNPVLFAPDRIDDTLPEVLAAAGLSHLHAAETEKYAHVTYFFAGGREAELAHETRILVPSRQDVATYDEAPAMSAVELTDRVESAWASGDYRFGIVNFANPDMVGHTGVLDASIAAMETVDRCVGRLVEAARARGDVVVLTADHGNVEHLLEADGSPNTAHTTNAVPVIVTDTGVSLRGGGVLADVAPTVLDLLDLEHPSLMTGRSLIAPGAGPAA